MVKIELSEKEKQGLTDEEIEIAKARKLEIILLPILKRNINFFYAGANIPRKSNAYNSEMDKYEIEKTLQEKNRTISAVCKPLCKIVAEILNENGIMAETVSCDTDIFRHTDVLMTTSLENQYIINYLEDMENIQTKMRTPDFASRKYYERRYMKFEGGVTTDGKRLDNIAFLSQERLEKIDENLGYKKYGLYQDDIINMIKCEFENFREVQAENEYLNQINFKDLSENEKNLKRDEITTEYQQMSDDEILERKLDWIFDYFNQRGDITGHTDFVMYYSRKLLAEVLSKEEYKKITRYDCFVNKEKLPEDNKIQEILDYENAEEENKLRFCLIKVGNISYAFSTKPNSYVKMTNDEVEKINKYATLSVSEKPSDLVLKLADYGCALPLVFNPLGQKFLDERAEMIPEDWSEEEKELETKKIAREIICTDGIYDAKNGRKTSMLIPYPDGTERLIYIDENAEFVEVYNDKKRVYHYSEETETFEVEDIDISSNIEKEEERDV